MERKGVYRKGRQGHARNINSYKFYREHMKNWRIPVIALLALVLVFTTAPTVGDNFKASVLTSEESAALVKMPKEESTKQLLSILKPFVQECEQFDLTDCAEDGNYLLSDVASGKWEVADTVLYSEIFVASYEEGLAQAKCKYVLPAYITQADQIHENVQSFVAMYGDIIDTDAFSSALTKFDRGVAALTSVVEGCPLR